MTHIKVPAGDIQFSQEEKDVILSILDSGRISEGKYIKEFERAWAKFIGTKFAVATSSGFGALMIGLAALKYKYKLPKGTKVLTTPVTYIADVSAIIHVGFEPVFVDISYENFNITAKNIEAALQNDKDIKIVLAVDLMGYPIEVDEIKEICKKYNVVFFEDAAEAHGSKYNNNICGSQSELAIYSFYIAHNIQAGELGALVTNDPEIYILAKKLKAQGRYCECMICTRNEGICPGLEKLKNKSEDFDPRFLHDIIGYNFKSMEFPAALALSQLKKIDQNITDRQENIAYLNAGLHDLENFLKLPWHSTDVSYLAYPIVIKKESPIKRKELRSKLSEAGIENRVLFGCLPTQQPALTEKYQKIYENKLPIAEEIGNNGLYIGCHQYLTKEQLDYVIETFHTIFHS